MSRIVDNLIAYRILTMLVQPFKETKAYELGIIDADGKVLKKTADLRTSEEKDAYTYLHRLVFKMKRIINKLPGGESRLRNIVAAYWLVKESYESGERSTSQIQQKFDDIVKLMHNNVVLAEEEITVRQYLQIFEDVGGAAGSPANSTGTNVSTDIAVIRKNGRKFASFNVNPEVINRFQKGKKKYKKWSEYLNLQDETEQKIYQFARRNPKAVIVLRNGDQMKAIRFNRNGGGSWNKLTNRKFQDIEVQVG